MNVHQWLESRAAGNALARWLLRILGALEATHSFQTISAYFRTYHNFTADSLTRDKCEEVDELLQRHGLELLDAKPDWALHLDRDWTCRVLAWHGQDPGDHQVALQLAERRQGFPLPATPTPLPVPRPGERFHVSEWRATGHLCCCSTWPRSPWLPHPFDRGTAPRVEHVAADDQA